MSSQAAACSQGLLALDLAFGSPSAHYPAGSWRDSDGSFVRVADQAWRSVRDLSSRGVWGRRRLRPWLMRGRRSTRRPGRRLARGRDRAGLGPRRMTWAPGMSRAWSHRSSGLARSNVTGRYPRRWCRPGLRSRCPAERDGRALELAPLCASRARLLKRRRRRPRAAARGWRPCCRRARSASQVGDVGELVARFLEQRGHAFGGFSRLAIRRSTPGRSRRQSASGRAR